MAAYNESKEKELQEDIREKRSVLTNPTRALSEAMSVEVHLPLEEVDNAVDAPVCTVVDVHDN